MKCPNCKAEMTEDAMFCENCGYKLEHEPKKEEGNIEVFCPNCGKAFKEGETFCDNCGTNLTDNHAMEPRKTELIKADESGKRRAGRKWMLPVLAIILVGIIGTGIYKTASGIFKGAKDKEIIRYFKDGTLYMTDLNHLEEQERVAV